MKLKGEWVIFRQSSRKRSLFSSLNLFGFNFPPLGAFKYSNKLILNTPLLAAGSFNVY